MFESGTEVHTVMGRRGYVVAPGAELTSVIFAGEQRPEAVATSSLERVEEKPAESSLDEFLVALTAYKLTSQLSDVVYGYLASRTQFRSYQFLPVLRFLESPIRRLLIADEVGLGKTIEAGLIWLELKARQQADRVMVVCPSSLRQKWQRELASRFDIDAVPVRSADLDALIEDVRSTPEHVTKRNNLIVSIETLRRDCRVTEGEPMTYGEALADSGLVWDLVIVDEAHHARNSTTKNHQAVDALGIAAEAVVFLTATPLNLGTPDLFNLLRLLTPQRFQSHDAFVDEIEPARHITAAVRAIREKDLTRVQHSLDQVGQGALGQRLRETAAFKQAEGILGRPESALTGRDRAQLEKSIRNLHPLSGVFTRTRKRDLTEPFAQRKVHRVDVHWTFQEREFYETVIDAARDGARGNPFAVVMPARQTASCLPVMLDRLRDTDFGYDPSEALERKESYRPDWFANMSPAMRQALERATRSLTPGQDTKRDIFVSHLRDLFNGDVRQALVFSFFRGTIAYLRKSLTAAGFSTEVMHGGVNPDDRYRIMERFRNGEFQILLSTEVGAEGLDFEFCACLVNYDLPWNPMRVEQRIGRLDRFGQQHERIIIVNFRIPGTIETDIFERLYERIGVFKDSIGDLDDILGSSLEDRAFRIAANLSLTAEERERQIDELAHTFELSRANVEELESHRDVLAASEELLTEEFDRVKNAGRLVDPVEVEAMVRSYLAAHYPATRWERSVDGEYAVELDHQLVESDGPLASAFRTAELRKLRQHAAMRTPLLCSFSADHASRRHQVEFLTSRHPLVGAIAESAAPTQFPFRTSCRVESPRIPGGQYVVGLYEVIVRSVNARKSLVTIAVDETSGVRAPLVEQNLLGVLATRHESLEHTETREILVNLDVLAAHERRAIENQSIIDAEVAYERRKRATEATFSPRIQQVSEAVSKSRGTRLEAANEGRLRRLKERYEATLRDIEGGRRPEVSIRHIATIHVDATDVPSTVDTPDVQNSVSPSSDPIFEPLSWESEPYPSASASTARCSRCDRSNTSGTLPPGDNCGNCGAQITGKCSTCGRLTSADGCLASRRSGLEGVAFTVVNARDRAESLHFTRAEIRKIQSEGGESEIVRHVTGEVVHESTFELDVAEVTVSDRGLIRQVSRRAAPA